MARGFSFMLERGRAPSSGSQRRHRRLHHPEYDFNDAALPYGMAYFARIVETALAA